ncbi:hypothetical protein DVH24_031040 [Malus domestica]|uniref:Putative plant transposon protein domain-containing protein n=1 Tax=Malus domestica TaxID=3750 RepID=A0A498HH84_MALDO|nr:hypothetical protein DVH24_031040 [Malus domestica]
MSIRHASIVDDLINCYKLHKVNSPPPTFNLSVVQEFYANVPSKFSNSGGKVYVRGVYVPFDSNVICDILGLDLSNASNMHSFDIITCHYDIHVYHHQAYLDSSIPLVKNQVSKSRLQHLYRLWSVCLRRNVLGSSNNGNHTLEAARVFYAMMSLSDVSFGFLISVQSCLRRSVQANDNMVPLFILVS